MRHMKKAGFLTAAIFLLFFTACGGKGDKKNGGTNPPPVKTDPKPPDIPVPKTPDPVDPDPGNPDEPGNPNEPGNPDEPDNPDEPGTGIAPQELKAVVGADGTERRIITFTASGPWTASAGICKVVPPSGAAGTRKVVVTCPPNNSGADREFTLTVTVTDGQDIVIPITQKPNPAPRTSDFTEITTVPEAVHTRAYGVNNNNAVIGSIHNSSGAEKAFLRNSGGGSTLIDNPAAAGNTHVYGINDDGYILGHYDGGYFLKTGTEYQKLANYQGTRPTEYTGVNKSGQLSGYFWTADGYARGFVKNDAGFTVINHPSANLTACSGGQCGTFITGINNHGQLSGYYVNADGVQHGFVKSGSSYIPIEHPDGDSGKLINTHVAGINDNGRLAGYFWGPDGYSRGFTTDGDRLIEIVHPDATGGGHGTSVYGINNSGRTVGWFDFGGKARGFLLYKQ